MARRETAPQSRSSQRAAKALGKGHRDGDGGDEQDNRHERDLALSSPISQYRSRAKRLD